MKTPHGYVFTNLKSNESFVLIINPPHLHIFLLSQSFLSKITQDISNEGCIEAYDITGSGITNLTSNIHRGALEMHNTTPNLYRIPFDVADEAGNTAETMYLEIEVEPVDIFPILEAATGEKRTLFRSVASIEQATPWILMALVTFILLPKFLSVLRAAFYAARYMYEPKSLVNCREDFELGYGLILRLKGLGMLSNKEKLRKTGFYESKKLFFDICTPSISHSYLLIRAIPLIHHSYSLGALARYN